MFTRLRSARGAKIARSARAFLLRKICWYPSDTDLWSAKQADLQLRRIVMACDSTYGSWVATKRIAHGWSVSRDKCVTRQCGRHDLITDLPVAEAGGHYVEDDGQK